MKYILITLAIVIFLIIMVPTIFKKLLCYFLRKSLESASSAEEMNDIIKIVYGNCVKSYPDAILLIEMRPGTDNNCGFVFDLSRYEKDGIVGVIVEQKDVKEIEYIVLPDQTLYLYEDGTMLWH